MNGQRKERREEERERERKKRQKENRYDCLGELGPERTFITSKPMMMEMKNGKMQADES